VLGGRPASGRPPPAEHRRDRRGRRPDFQATGGDFYPVLTGYSMQDSLELAVERNLQEMSPVVGSRGRVLAAPPSRHGWGAAHRSDLREDSAPRGRLLA
jgi:hypothetical protein